MLISILTSMGIVFGPHIFWKQLLITKSEVGIVLRLMSKLQMGCGCVQGWKVGAIIGRQLLLGLVFLGATDRYHGFHLVDSLLDVVVGQSKVLVDLFLVGLVGLGNREGSHYTNDCDG